MQEPVHGATNTLSTPISEAGAEPRASLSDEVLHGGIAQVAPEEPRFRVADFGVILKPRVMSLVVFTGWVGMILAPGPIDPITALIGVFCIAVGAGASGAINMWYDSDIDRLMARTMRRPTAIGRMDPREALAFGSVLAVGSVVCMGIWVNAVASALLALTIVYYVFIYTMWLKRRTPQNIVIGGASGALPPTIGWAAVTGDIGIGAVTLFLIIFLWTPPHTWALALFRNNDYSRAGVPMMPVVVGPKRTKVQIAVYTALLIPVTLAPTAIGMAGWFYGGVAALLAVGLVRHVVRLWSDEENKTARPMFFFTIFYLFGIFAALLIDRGLSGVL